MKKTILALSMGAMMASGMVQAGEYKATVGMSTATQEVEVMNVTADAANTGIFIDWNKSSFAGVEYLGAGMQWNGATEEGNVLTAYVMPNVDVNDKTNLFAKIGYSLTGATGADGGSMAYGFGATYQVSEKYGVTVSYDNLYSDDMWDMTAVNAGVTYMY